MIPQAPQATEGNNAESGEIRGRMIGAGIEEPGDMLTESGPAYGVNRLSGKTVTFTPLCASHAKPMDVAAKPAPGSCQEKARLLEEFRETLRLFGLAGSALSSARPSATMTEYERLRISSEHARNKSEEARLALDRHIMEHGC